MIGNEGDIYGDRARDGSYNHAERSWDHLNNVEAVRYHPSKKSDSLKRNLYVVRAAAAELPVTNQHFAIAITANFQVSSIFKQLRCLIHTDDEATQNFVILNVSDKVGDKVEIIEHPNSVCNLPLACPNDCNGSEKAEKGEGRGSCTASGVCVCNDNWVGDTCEMKGIGVLLYLILLQSAVTILST